MKELSFRERPIEIFGLVGDKDGSLVRLPREVAERTNETVARRYNRFVGGRVRFRTNSKKVGVRIRLETLSVDWAIPLSGSAGADVYVGTGKTVRFAMTVAPKDYNTKEVEGFFQKNGETEDVIINLPRNEKVGMVTILLEDDAEIEPPAPYSIQTPVVFYGSSITEGGCASRPGNAYTSLVSRWLNVDYRNLGFSGAARGEPVIAEYIANLKMGAFVLDYDHNAPNPNHLQETHRNFFNIIRSAQPELPIVILSKPDFDTNPNDASKRRAIIMETYNSAVSAGDKHVWFIDGETLFGTDDRTGCTIEGCHPNDLGFFRMAQAVYPVLKEALGI